MASCQDCFFLRGQLGEGREIVRETYVFYSQLWVYSYRCYYKRGFLALYSQQIIDFQMISGDSMNHRHPHGLRHQQDHGPQLRLWWQHRTSNTDINMTFGGSIYNGHQHGLLHRPWASMWPPVAWLMDLNRASGAQATHSIISFILKSPCGLIRVDYFYFLMQSSIFKGIQIKYNWKTEFRSKTLLLGVF